MAIIAVALFLLDDAALRSRRRDLSQAFTCGAIAKALLQILPLAEILIGKITVPLVDQLPGRGGPLSVLIATLICGACLAGMAIAIGLLLVTSGPPSPASR